ncbi:MAG: cyclic nucleotide-binding domain-containing protein [Solidesulfovibrio sp.]
MDEREIAISDRVMALLRRMPSFAELDPLDIRELFHGEGLLRFREYQPGETIIREGDLDSWVYYLISGQVRVLSQEAQVAMLSGYGEIFGEMGPLRSRPRNASVVAHTAVSCFSIDLSLLDRLPADDRKRGSQLFEEVLNDVVHERLARANLDAAALRRDLAMAASALAGVNDRARELERRVHELTKENQELRKLCGK